MPSPHLGTSLALPIGLWDRQFFGLLPPPLLKELEALKELQIFPRGERVYGQGERPQGVYSLIHGGLKILRADERGRKMVLQFLKPGTSVGILPVFDGTPSLYSVVAHRDSRCWFIPAGPLKASASGRPEVMDAVLRHLCERIRSFTDLVFGLGLQSVPERVAAFLLRCYQEQGRRPLIEFDVNQDEIGHYLGCSRAAFSRTLRLFADMGLLRNTFPVVRLVDLPRLERLANHGSCHSSRHGGGPAFLDPAVLSSEAGTLQRNGFKEGAPSADPTSPWPPGSR